MLRIDQKGTLIRNWRKYAVYGMKKCNIVILLIHVEETKLNNYNANDHETAHAGTFS